MFTNIYIYFHKYSISTYICKPFLTNTRHVEMQVEHKKNNKLTLISLHIHFSVCLLLSLLLFCFHLLGKFGGFSCIVVDLTLKGCTYIISFRIFMYVCLQKNVYIFFTYVTFERFNYNNNFNVGILYVKILRWLLKMCVYLTAALFVYFCALTVSFIY